MTQRLENITGSKVTSTKKIARIYIGRNNDDSIFCQLMINNRIMSHYEEIVRLPYDKKIRKILQEGVKESEGVIKIMMSKAALEQIGRGFADDMDNEGISDYKVFNGSKYDSKFKKVIDTFELEHGFEFVLSGIINLQIIEYKGRLK